MSLSAGPARHVAVVALLLIAALLIAALLLPSAAHARAVTPAPLLGAAGAGAERYVVVLREAATGPVSARVPGGGDRVVTARRAPGAHAAARARAGGARILHTYDSTVAGYAAVLTRSQLARVRSDPAVAYVEADRVVSIEGTQTGATWGLDRVDQRNLPLDRSYSYGPTGAGVDAYVVDTGVLGSHTEFSGRMSPGFSAIADGRGTTDCEGHGTHVAGTIAGSTWGVAKQATVVPVRVLDCNGEGYLSGIIAGVDWLTSVASGPSVANLSLGGPASRAMDDAVGRAIGRGVTVVVAAGNENVSACTVSPARAPAAITVGATTTTDARAGFSNYGSCLDVFAPGTGITSAWSTSPSQTNTISGTSMAAPHVAGVAALYLQSSPTAAPAAVASSIVGATTTGRVTGAGTGSPNRLLYSGYLPAVTPPVGSRACDPVEHSYTGTVAAGGKAAVPSGYPLYVSEVAGTHAACLTGPAGTNHDLYLLTWDSSVLMWVVVASSTTSTSGEILSWTGPSGLYFWQVRSAGASGSFTLSTVRPG